MGRSFLRSVLGACFLSLFFPLLFGQGTVPPINRDVEAFERSVKRNRREQERYKREYLEKAIKEAKAAADELQAKAREVDATAASYFNAALSHREFKKRLKTQTKRIRKLARPIEEIEFLDPGDNDETRSFTKARSPRQIEALIAELKTVSQTLHDRVYALTGPGVTISGLKEPSLEALAEETKRLAKTISGSINQVQRPSTP